MAQEKKPATFTRNKTLRNQIRNFNRRWNITLNENDEVGKFRNRVLAIIDSVVGEYILRNTHISREYAFALGHQLPPSATTGISDWGALTLSGKDFKDDIVYQSLYLSMDLLKFISALQILFSVLEEYACPKISELANGVQLAIDYSPNINLRIINKSNHVTIYRASVKVLDETIVDETLLWLEGKPVVAKHFEQALRIYLSKDATKYRNLLDNLRLALEQLVRAVLGNKKSLENQKPFLLSWLKGRGSHQQIVNLYDDLLARYVQYQNDAVKHGDDWSAIEIEFMIYLTGVFMHFLLQLDTDAHE